MANGTEALEGAPKTEEKKGTEGEKKPRKPRKKLHHIISRKLKDGTVHHRHVYQSPDGGPDLNPGSDGEFSSPNADDAGDHVAQALGGGGGADPDAGADPAAAAAPAAAPAGGAPGAAAGQ